MLSYVCDSEGQAPQTVLLCHCNLLAEYDGGSSGGGSCKASEDNAKNGVVEQQADNDLAGD